MFSPIGSAYSYGAAGGYVTVTLQGFAFSGMNHRTVTVPFEQAATYQSFLYALANMLPMTVSKHIYQGRCQFLSPRTGSYISPANWDYCIRPGMSLVMRKTDHVIGAGYGMDPYMGGMMTPRSMGDMGMVGGAGAIPGGYYGRRNSMGFKTWMLS